LNLLDIKTIYLLLIFFTPQPLNMQNLQDLPSEAISEVKFQMFTN